MRFHRRWWFRSLVGLATTLGISLAWVLWERHKARQEFDAVIAEVDAGDPKWRFADIEANRRAVPDAENAARFINAAVKLIPKDSHQPTAKLLEALQRSRPNYRQPPSLMYRVKAQLAKLTDALAESRKIANFPRGRFAVEHAPDWMSTSIQDQSDAQLPASILTLDCHEQIAERKLDQALRTIVAQFHIAHCFHDEPGSATQFMRLGQQSVILDSVERLLGQGELRDDDLQRVQRLLEDEAAAQSFVTGLRGDRAGMHQFFDFIMHRDMPVMAAIGEMTRGRATGRPDNISLWEYAFDIYAPVMVHRSSAWMLKYQTKVLDAASRPAASRYSALRELDAEFHVMKNENRKDLMLAKLMTPAFMRIVEAEQKNDTHLHCAIAAVAAERLRLKLRRWPNSLDELVAKKLLSKVPEDLYTGEPVRLRLAADGIVVYSVGPGGVGQGDGLDDAEAANPDGKPIMPVGRGVEFRLWDVAQRGLPPLASVYREWIIGRWKSHKLEVREFPAWKGTEGIELVATAPDDIELFLIDREGKRELIAGTGSSRMTDKTLSFGLADGDLVMTYRHPSDDILILTSANGQIHVELRRVDPED
jgi:hypothetical protein